MISRAIAGLAVCEGDDRGGEANESDPEVPANPQF